ncbi:NUDT3 [Symbiodinium natans]|uniref:NUDT3 protein n=1 Tax=Symbiodinium natans TaxID=878477 RepID=A0A812LQJ5_9DINO|nr:NUDT3 [Symbiodinium natans]
MPAQVKENKDHQVLDTLDAEGSCFGTRTRGAVTEKGLWHRYVHVWVLNLPDSAVLMQLRAPEKKRFGGMWNCTSGFVMSGMPSLEACKKHLDAESGMKFEDHKYEFVFSCKEISEFKGETLRQWIDVYVVSLKKPPELRKIFYDIKEASELKYIGVGELEQAYQTQDPSFVLVAAPEYSRRLFHFLHKQIRTYLEMLPKVDSDEERHNKKSQQLLDRIGDISMLDRAQDLNVIVDPCRRIEAYNESVWHRAVHVWVFDIEGGRFLIQQRSPKKRHFGGKWNCSTGHIKMGDPALPTAMKSAPDLHRPNLDLDPKYPLRYSGRASPCWDALGPL